MDDCGGQRNTRDQSNTKIILKGKKIREEFLCPISYEVFHEPVVASDGNTYEKTAIESWIRGKTSETLISPLSGDVMESLTLPNRTFQKLIHDMISEGGIGLFRDDDQDPHRIIEIHKEKILKLKCNFPNTSDMHGKVYLVRRNGCVGGRGNFPTDQEKNSRDLIMFNDIEVSRRHFEIFMRDNGEYSIRDLGSSGGMFVRIPKRKDIPLKKGMVILIGSHQYTVTSVPTQCLNQNKGIEEAMSMMSDLSISNDEISTAAISLDIGVPDSAKVCVLKCNEPVGSPLLGKEYRITEHGGTIGRNPICEVSLSMKKSGEDGTLKTYEVDRNVSGKHATISFDSRSGEFAITDGNGGKSSTNGVWLRINEGLEDIILTNFDELLVGKTKFDISTSHTIVEKVISE